MLSYNDGWRFGAGVDNLTSVKTLQNVGAQYGRARYRFHWATSTTMKLRVKIRSTGSGVVQSCERRRTVAAKIERQDQHCRNRGGSRLETHAQPPASRRIRVPRPTRKK
eukprot:scaffold1736_cov127-Cylindrotheca_fusiformis.AAC.12